MKRIYRCDCGTRLSSEGSARYNRTCAKCARLKRERMRLKRGE